MSRGVRITTGARLHFGLLDIAAPFGGCGVMIDEPATVVEATPAEQFGYCEINGLHDHAHRATAIARRIAERSGGSAMLPPVNLRVTQAAPPHTGLGSGTQLSLAIAEVIVQLLHSPRLASIACDTSFWRDIWLRAADRGKRSAVGTYGYQQGGFITEGLQPESRDGVLNTLNRRIDLPAQWRVAILLPETDFHLEATVSGEQEQAKFAALPPVPRQHRDSLARLLTDSLMPAIENADFSAFCDALTQYNRTSGLLFADVQGGAYHGEATSQLIHRLLQQGYPGVGQSSWGPGVFVWHPDTRSAEQFRKQWSRPDCRVLIAAPKSDGRRLEEISSHLWSDRQHGG